MWEKLMILKKYEKSLQFHKNIKKLKQFWKNLRYLKKIEHLQQKRII